MGRSTISMVIFRTYLSLPEGKSHQIALNHHFPMVFSDNFPIFPWFSYGFPMVFPVQHPIFQRHAGGRCMPPMAAAPGPTEICDIGKSDSDFDVDLYRDI